MSAAAAETRYDVPAELDPRFFVDGIGALYSGAANVIMQLSLRPVAYGVMESTVEGGRVDKHPYKRQRTTLTYLGVALMGTDEDRAVYREAVNTAHRHVRSTEQSPVRYNAFDRNLQLWVAACLYYGATDVYEQLHGPLDEDTHAALYPYASRLGTTLRVPEEMWPADQATMKTYLDAGLEAAEFDEQTKAYLLALLRFEMVSKLLRPLTFFFTFMNTGYLPAPLRDKLGLSWSPRRQRVWQRVNRATGWTYRRLPRVARMFPFNLYLWDMRRRVRKGKRLV